MYYAIETFVYKMSCACLLKMYVYVCVRLGTLNRETETNMLCKNLFNEKKKYKYLMKSNDANDALMNDFKVNVISAWREKSMV